MDEALEPLFRALRGDAEAPRQSPARDKLLAAAREMFAEQGFAATPTRHIAKRAGVAEKTLFQHFGSKAGLFAAALAPGLEGLLGPAGFTELAQILAGTEQDPELRLRAAAENRLKFAREHTGLMRTVVQETLLSPPFRARMIDYWRERLWPPAAIMFASAQRGGRLRKDVEPGQAVRMFVSLILGYLLTRHVLLPDADWDDGAELDAMLEVFLRGIAPQGSGDAS